MSSKELLAEYAKLAAKLEHINETLQEMNAVDIAQLIDKIRVVERKMSLVYTLFKQSVYSITMQNAQNDQDQQHQSQEQEQEQQHDQSEEDKQQYQSTTPPQHLNHSQNQDNRRYSQEAQQQQQQQQYQDHSDYDTSPPQSQQQQQQQQQALRSSLRTSSNDNNSSNSNSNITQPTSILRNSVYRTTNPSRTSNAREEYQATTGNKSILALSRGHEGRSRWGNHYGYHSGSAGGTESENQTNRPRYH